MKKKHMSCKELTSKKYRTRPSPPFPANSCQDMSKLGNDGQMYKSVANRNNVHQWKLIQQIQEHSTTENTYELTNCKKFEMIRNNSLISKYEIVTLNKMGILHVVDDFGEVYIDLYHFKFEYEMEKGYIEIAFDTIDNTRYRLRITNHKQESGINDILSLIPSHYLLTSDDSLPITKGHHFGDLILFTPKLLKYLEKSRKYYIVVGQQWDTDFTGERSIGVLQYEGFVKNEFGSIDILGIMWNIFGDRQKEVVRKEDNFSPISSDGMTGLFGTGSGHDPVHLILRFAKKFKLPKFLPKAECVSI
jgi:hypothetical protein